MRPHSPVTKLRRLKDVLGTGWSDGDVPAYNESEDRFEPGAGGGGGSGVVYADDPPDEPAVGTVYIDATGLGIGPDGGRT